MAYVICSKSGQEIVFRNKPIRHFMWQDWIPNDISENRYIILPKGSIRKLIGRELTFYDEPVKLEN